MIHYRWEAISEPSRPIPLERGQAVHSGQILDLWAGAQNEDHCLAPGTGS